MDFPQMGPGPDMQAAAASPDDATGGRIDPAIIQALVMALLGQNNGGQQNIIEMLQQIDPRALQSLVFGGALGGQ